MKPFVDGSGRCSSIKQQEQAASIKSLGSKTSCRKLRNAVLPDSVSHPKMSSLMRGCISNWSACNLEESNHKGVLEGVWTKMEIWEVAHWDWRNPRFATIGK